MSSRLILCSGLAASWQLVFVSLMTIPDYQLMGSSRLDIVLGSRLIGSFKLAFLGLHEGQRALPS